MLDEIILQSQNKEHPICRATGYSLQTIHRLEKAGRFPQRLQLGPGRVGWKKSEVEAWLAGRQRGPLLAPHKQAPPVIAAPFNPRGLERRRRRARALNPASGRVGSCSDTGSFSHHVTDLARP